MIKNLPIRLIVLAIVVLIGIFLYDRIQDNQNNKIMDAKLSLAISQYENGEISYIDIATITNNFVWDKLYIFTPYTSDEKIDKDLKTFWLGLRFTGFGTNAYQSLLVFTQNGKVVGYLEYHRFSHVENGKWYAFNDARFILDQTGYMVWVSKQSE